MLLHNILQILFWFPNLNVLCASFGSRDWICCLASCKLQIGSEKIEFHDKQGLHPVFVAHWEKQIRCQGDSRDDFCCYLAYLLASLLGLFWVFGLSLWVQKIVYLDRLQIFPNGLETFAGFLDIKGSLRWVVQTYIWVVHTKSCFPLPRVLLHIMLPRGDEAWGTSSCVQIRLSPLISANSSRGGERANTLVSNLLCFEACELVWRHLQFIAGKIEWIPAAGICYIMVYNTPGINNAWLNRLCPDFRTKLLSPLQKVLDSKMFPSISQCSIIANFLAAMSLIYHFPFSQTLNGEKILHLSKNASLVKNSYCLPFGYLATMSFMNS